MSSGQTLVEGRDYYFESGKMVLTSHFLLRRGYCCNSGCRHCPYKEGQQPKVPLQIKGLDPKADVPNDEE